MKSSSSVGPASRRSAISLRAAAAIESRSAGSAEMRIVNSTESTGSSTRVATENGEYEARQLFAYPVRQPLLKDQVEERNVHADLGVERDLVGEHKGYAAELSCARLNQPLQHAGRWIGPGIGEPVRCGVTRKRADVAPGEILEIVDEKVTGEHEHEVARVQETLLIDRLCASKVEGLQILYRWHRCEAVVARVSRVRYCELHREIGRPMSVHRERQLLAVDAAGLAC